MILGLHRPAWLVSLILALAHVLTFGAELTVVLPAGTKPTLFLIGDSTVRNRTRGQLGWGDTISDWFDLSRITVTNHALGGRSSRTFLTEGLWDKVLGELKPGDFVLMQFGHNDGGPLDDGRARASLKGNGEESRVVTNQVSGKVETVRSFGWYLRKYISDAKARGATPIVLSLVPRKIWKDGKIVRASSDYAKWAAEAAKAEGVAFVDLNEMVARHYEELGPEKVNSLFADDHTHTNPEGARLNARSVVEGLRALKDCTLTKYLVAATVVDASGVPVPDADDLVSFKLSGPARIAAVDSGDNSSHESFRAEARRAYQGQRIAILQATAPAGQIRLTASAPGLAPADLILDVGSSPEGKLNRHNDQKDRATNARATYKANLF